MQQGSGRAMTSGGGQEMSPYGAFGGPGGAGAAQGQGLRTLWSPHIEVAQRDGKLTIEADLPGVRKEDLEVRIEPDAVILQGHRQQESTRDEQGFYHSERSYGSFYRAIPLPEGIDTEQAHATFRDGVLCIELPAPQQRQRGRRLEIRDGGAPIEGSASGASSGYASSTSGSSAHAAAPKPRAATRRPERSRSARQGRRHASALPRRLSFVPAIERRAHGPWSAKGIALVSSSSSARAL